MAPYPIEDEIFVLQGGQKMGPFHVETLLDGLETGVFSYDDICLRKGASECERIKDFLDWDQPDLPLPLKQPPLGIASTSQVDDRDLAASSSGEEMPVYAGHPSILNSPIPLLCIVFGTTGGVWLFPLDPTFTAVALGASLLGLIQIGFIRFTQSYEISPKRVGAISGFIARSSKEVRVADIRAIHVTCRGLKGMLGIGSVDFFTTGDFPEVSFKNIWAAQKVKALVRRLQDN